MMCCAAVLEQLLIKVLVRWVEKTKSGNDFDQALRRQQADLIESCSQWAFCYHQ
jgi:hypothetical protein